MARPDIHNFIDKIHAGDPRLNRGWVRQAAKLLNEPYHTSDDDVWALLAAVDAKVPSLNITDLKIMYGAVSKGFPAMRRFFIESAARGKHAPLEIRFAKMVGADPSEDSYRECCEVLKQEKGHQAVDLMDKALAEEALIQAVLRKNTFLLERIMAKDNWQDIQLRPSGLYSKNDKQECGWIAAWTGICQPMAETFETHQLPILDRLLYGGAQINVMGRRGTGSHALEIMCDRMNGCWKFSSEYEGFKKCIEALLERGASWENILANPMAIEIIRAHPAFIRDELTKVAGAGDKNDSDNSSPRPAM